MAVQPWNLFSAEEILFVGMFALAGLAGAAGIVNFVVLTSATSSANSGIMSTSRMIHGLAEEGDAPKVFAKLSRTKVPRNALLFSCMFLLAGVALLYAKGSGWLRPSPWSPLSRRCASCSCGRSSWSATSSTARRRPQLHEESKFKMPGGTFMPYVVLAFFGFIIWALTTQADTLMALLFTPIWFVALGIGYMLLRRSPQHAALRALHGAKVIEEHKSAAAFNAGLGAEESKLREPAAK